MATASDEPKHNYKYTLVKDVFEQDDNDFVPTIDQIQPRLGLKGNTWPDVAALNASAPHGTSYKLFIVGRHGQGYHNVSLIKYGRVEWRAKWSFLTGDDEMTWGPDPPLTPIGLDQARTANAAWKEHSPPSPDALFCSPLRRALNTCAITFPERIADVVVLEDVREKLTGHTCDIRSPISTVRGLFPSFNYSLYKDVDEEDPWGKRTETDDQVAARAERALDYIFDTNPAAQVVSITAHADWIEALFSVTKRRHYLLQTGGITPLLIKAEKVIG